MQDMVDAMTKAMEGMAYYIVMAFFCALFVDAFSSSNIGALLAAVLVFISGCNLEENMNEFLETATFSTPDIGSLPDGDYKGRFRAGIDPRLHGGHVTGIEAGHHARADLVPASRTRPQPRTWTRPSCCRDRVPVPARRRPDSRCWGA